MTLAAVKRTLEILAPENLRDPFPLYRQLQESDPVHWSETVHAWFITRHEDVAACFRDPRLSSDRTQFFINHQLRGMGEDKVKELVSISNRQMVMKDGMEHTRLRRNANPGFTPQAIERWRPDVIKTTDKVLEQIHDMKRMDVVRDYAELLPLLVIMEFFDIPVKDRLDFQHWSTTTLRLFGTSTEGDVMEIASQANAAISQLFRYVEGIVHERRVKPGRDMLSTMIHAQEEGRLEDASLIPNAILLLTAGHLTTADQLSNGVHALLTHPEELQKLKENPALSKSAVEEILRYGPSVPFIHRIATEDFELRGRTIQRGQVVFLGMAAANRDPSVFPDPDRFDITRQGNKHLAFAFGPHMCLGATLARLELEVGFERLLQRLPGLRLDETRPALPKCNSLVFRGFDSLPVCW
jgi:cytochrome P450